MRLLGTCCEIECRQFVHHTVVGSARCPLKQPVKYCASFQDDIGKTVFCYRINVS